MSKICLSCGKKIGVFSNVISTDHRDGTLCYDCADYLTKVTSLYYKTPNCYSGQQLRNCMTHMDEMIKHINAVNKITCQYQSIMGQYQGNVNAYKQRIAELENEDEREHVEFEKKLEDTELSYKDLPNINEMKIRYEHQKRLGHSSEASETARLIEQFEQFALDYEKEKQSIIDTCNHFSEGRNLLMDVAETYKESCEKNINLYNRVLQAEKFIYSKTKLPDEKYIFGGVGAEIKSNSEKISACIDEILIIYCDIINIYFNEQSGTDDKLFRQIEKTYHFLFSENDDLSETKETFENVNNYDVSNNDFINSFDYRLNESEKNKLKEKIELLYPLYLQYIELAVKNISKNITLYSKLYELKYCAEYDKWVNSPIENNCKAKVVQSEFGYKIEDFYKIKTQYYESCNIIKDIHSELKKIAPKLETILPDYHIEEKEFNNNQDIYNEVDDDPYEIVCPKCGYSIDVELNIVASGSMICPHCGEKLEFDFDDESENEGDKSEADDSLALNKSADNKPFQSDFPARTAAILNLVAVLQNIANTKQSSDSISELANLIYGNAGSTSKNNVNSSQQITNDYFNKTSFDTAAAVSQIKLCPTCKRENKDTAKFCKYCGESLEPARFCEECGSKLKPSKKFCSKCGAKIEEGD